MPFWLVSSKNSKLSQLDERIECGFPRIERIYADKNIVTDLKKQILILQVWMIKTSISESFQFIGIKIRINPLNQRESAFYSYLNFQFINRTLFSPGHE